PGCSTLTPKASPESARPIAQYQARQALKPSSSVDTMPKLRKLEPRPVPPSTSASVAPITPGDTAKQCTCTHCPLHAPPAPDGQPCIILTVAIKSALDPSAS